MTLLPPLCPEAVKSRNYVLKPINHQKITIIHIKRLSLSVCTVCWIDEGWSGGLSILPNPIFNFQGTKTRSAD